MHERSVMQSLYHSRRLLQCKVHMCDVWQYPTKPSDEITVKDIEEIPSGLRFINITGGEPFAR